MDRPFSPIFNCALIGCTIFTTSADTGKYSDVSVEWLAREIEVT